MPPSILVIHGVAQTSEWYLRELQKSNVLRATQATLKLVNFEYGANPGPVITALDSGDHSAAVVCDLSWDHNKFLSLLGPFLKRFVFENGGRLAFPTTEGLLLVPVLKILFHVPWERGAYYATAWGPRREAATRLDITFPIHNFLPQATRPSNLIFHTKACSLVNVPKEDRCYGYSKDCDSFSMLLSETYFPDSEGESEDGGEGSAADPCDESEKTEVVVATRNCGAGKICFFGDVNAGMETADLVFAFCLA